MTDTWAPPFAVWQGFHHRWTYNHRLNRLGDWVRSEARVEDRLDLEVGHSAASGSGYDKASFTTHAAILRANGIGVHERKRTFTISGKEQSDQIFSEEFRISNVAAGHDTFAACIAGFDIAAVDDSDKLASFHLSVTTPERDSRTGDVVLHAIGGLNVDCDSPECDNAGSVANILAGLAGGYTTIGAGVVSGGLGALAGVALANFFAKLKLGTEYRITIRVLLLTGEVDTLTSTRSLHAHTLNWDKKTAIRLPEDGVRRVTLTGDRADHWRVAVPAISQISLEVSRERGILKPDTAMHLLEWDMAVRPLSTTGQSCEAELDLFFRNWRERPSAYYEEHIDNQMPIPIANEILGAVATHRDAGTANIQMGLTLLQFAETLPREQLALEGSLEWPGKGASALGSDAERIRTRCYEMALADTALPPDPPPPTRNAAPMLIALRNLA